MPLPLRPRQASLRCLRLRCPIQCWVTEEVAWIIFIAGVERRAEKAQLISLWWLPQLVWFGINNTVWLQWRLSSVCLSWLRSIYNEQDRFLWGFLFLLSERVVMSDRSYGHQEVVWCRCGGLFWPGEVRSLDSLPADIRDGFLKTPLVVVKFFDEDG